MRHSKTVSEKAVVLRVVGGGGGVFSICRERGGRETQRERGGEVGV